MQDCPAAPSHLVFPAGQPVQEVADPLLHCLPASQAEIAPSSRGQALSRPAPDRLIGVEVRAVPPHKWAVGHTTFEFSFSLPEPANPGNCSKTKKKQPGPPPRKSTASTRPGEAPPKARKLKPHTKPDSASVETKKQERAEYERQRNQTPERKERARLLAQARQRKAKELGKCRNCIRPAIPGQTRCETCADHHRQSRRRSDAKRRDIAEPTPTTEK